MLEVINLVKEFNNTTAVNNISFKVEPGKIFGLLGPNGAGKTTTIRIILDILKPSSGEIKFSGKKIDQNFQNITGYLPEERGLYKKNKVFSVICYFAELKNIETKKAHQLTDFWLKKLNMFEYRNRKVEELSKGNQQKIQFITAIVHNPNVLILDEPFSGFDPINQQEIKELILALVNEGKTIILSTHQMELAEKLCSEIFLINKGLEVISGNLNDVKKKFGTKNIKIEYNGDATFINEMDEVVHLDLYQNYAEVQLKQEAYPTNFLRKIVERIEINNFSVLEPTLNRIFIDAVSKSKGEL